MEDDDNAIEDDFDYGHANTVFGIVLRPPVHPRSYGVCNDATVYTYVGKVNNKYETGHTRQTLRRQTPQRLQSTTTKDTDFSSGVE